MNNKHSDLIAIANADLAKKLDSKANLEKEAQNTNISENAVRSFQEDIWKAVYTLNLFRYGFGILLLILTILPTLEIDINLIETPLHPRLFFLSTNLLLFSAVLFSYIIKYKEISFNLLVTSQFSLDVVLAALITYSTGSIDSNFSMLYILMVATASVVLPRKLALGVAAGTIILMFFEHFYSVLVSPSPLTPNYSLLVRYALILFAAGWLISKLAARIHASEVQNFIPGNETIEEFLVREEKKALANALEQANGNKTEAAKLLGMTFRSFRYKLSKYDIG